MTAQTGFSHIVVGSAPEEEETVIQAGCGYVGVQDSATEEEPAVALPAAAAAPTRVQTARRSAASNKAQTSQKKATGKKTADGLEPMGGTQKTVIIGAVLLVVAFVVYCFFFM